MTSLHTAHQDYQGMMQWEQGRAEALCQGNCDTGPQTSNVGFGPDGGGSMITAVCREDCANCIRKEMPSAWVVVDSGRE